MHAETLVEPAMEIVSLGQSVQAAAPADEYVLAGQVVQLFAPAAA